MLDGAPCVAILVAAGSGRRTGLDTPKQFVVLGGRTLLAHAAAALCDHHAIDRVVPVVGPDQTEAATAALFGLRTDPSIAGGATRRLSVAAGINVLADLPDDAVVLVHDAARPALPAAVVDRLLAALAGPQVEGAVPVLPIEDTIIAAGDILGAVIDRDTLRRVQTPQAFRLGALRRAHAGWIGAEPTDDGGMVRQTGGRVVTIAGDVRLAKVTVAADLDRVAREFHHSMIACTGFGFDVHRFCPGDHLWLGGLRIPHSHGLEGHSDADVALHALTDAILGAIADGDIGSHFPPSDPRWKGAASGQFLEHARDLVTARGGIIDHCDITILCEAPKIGPHRDAIRASIAALLRLPVQRVSVKATTTERLGFTGRGEGMAAQAVATVRLPKENETA